MCVEHSGLVIGSLEYGGASHSRFGGGNESEVLAGDS